MFSRGDPDQTFAGFILLILAHVAFLFRYNLQWMKPTLVVSYRRWTILSGLLLLGSMALFSTQYRKSYSAESFFVVLGILSVLYCCVAVTVVYRSSYGPLVLVALLSTWLTIGGLEGGRNHLTGSLLMGLGTPFLVYAISTPTQHVSVGMLGLVSLGSGAHLLSSS